MFMRKFKGSLILVGLCCWQASFGASESLPNLGRELSAKEVLEIPAQVFADGKGLPAGSGTAAQGQALYNLRCAGCHGSKGEGGRAVELVGDRELLATEYPDRGIAVYWPFAPTLFEYIRRAMPPGEPYSLTADETYAVIARVLQLNDLLVGEPTVDAAFLSSLKLPNRDGFISDHY